MHRNAADIRKLVDKKLGRKVSDGIWDYVEDKLYVEDVLKGGLLDDLLDEIKPLQALAAPAERRPTRVVQDAPLLVDRGEAHLSEATSIYQEALSEVVVAAADSDPDVAAFRGKVLSDKLMAWD